MMHQKDKKYLWKKKNENLVVSLIKASRDGSFKDLLALGRILFFKT